MSKYYPVYTRNDLAPLGTRNVQDECTRGEYKNTCLYFESAGWLTPKDGEKLEDIMCQRCYNHMLAVKVMTEDKFF